MLDKRLKKLGLKIRDWYIKHPSATMIILAGLYQWMAWTAEGNPEKTAFVAWAMLMSISILCFLFAIYYTLSQKDKARVRKLLKIKESNDES